MGAWPSKAIIASTPAKPPPPPPEARSRPSRWSGLPPELAGLVLRRLPILADRTRFGSVCRHWRHAVRQQAPALPPAFPWIISFCGRKYRSIQQDGQVHRLLRSSQLTACWGSSENWLLLTGPWHPNKNSTFLENPLSRAIIQLPGQLRPDDGFPELWCLQKFIVCSNDLIVATTLTTSPPLVACYRPGTSSWSTSSHAGGDSESYYQDIAVYRGDIYAITRGGDLFAHEVSVDSTGHGETTTTVSVSAAKRVIKGSDTCDAVAVSRFLVVSRGRLLMVNHEKRFGVLEGSVFKVFEADVEMSRWSMLTSIGDQVVLFLSRRCSKAIPASSHDEYLCGGNRIYFLDQPLYGPDKCRSESGLVSCGMYDMRDNTYHPIVSNVPRVGDVTAWFFPQK
uniref:Uncharacterized protein n=1 Tax=Avena sativa TaxID=4498 RepID=A0ACD5XP75_AVESA